MQILRKSHRSYDRNKIEAYTSETGCWVDAGDDPPGQRYWCAAKDNRNSCKSGTYKTKKPKKSAFCEPNSV